MAFAILIYPIHLAKVLTYCALLGCAPSTVELDSQGVQSQRMEPTLVRVNIVTETRGAKDTVEINGQLLTNYSPIIIQSFSATGIVLDHRDHIMTFLGYRWPEIQDHDPRIEISAGGGQKWKGKLIGIDQNTGVAVIRLLGGKLNKTPVCTRCEVKNGITIMAPVIEGPAPSQYGEAQILSVRDDGGVPEQGSWIVGVNRPFPDIGQPILTTDHRVLGFVASQNPMGTRTVVYRISSLLSSAEKILKKGGDIPAGWLGIYLVDSYTPAGPGIVIQRIEPDSPAQKAGLVADDFLFKYNGQAIQDALQFIQLVQGTPIGSKANLEILRRGNPMTITALIEAWRPQQNQGKLSFSLPGALGPPFAGMIPGAPPGNPRLLFGLDTIMLTSSLADALKMPGQTGLLVIGVDKQLPADLAGVLVGDVIVSIDGQPIVDAPGFASYLQTHIWGPQSVLKVLRKGIERTIAVQIPGANR